MGGVVDLWKVECLWSFGGLVVYSGVKECSGIQYNHCFCRLSSVVHTCRVVALYALFALDSGAFSVV